MEIAIVLLLIVLGGGALLVGLIFAIVTGSARSERLRRIEQDQMDLRAALAQANARVAYLERAMGDAFAKLSYVHAEQMALEAREAEHPAREATEPAPAREARAAARSEPEVAPRTPAPEPAAPLPEAAPPAAAAPTEAAPAPAPVVSEAGAPVEAAESAEKPPAEIPTPEAASAEPSSPAPAEPSSPAAPVVPVWPAPPSSTAPEAAPPYAAAARAPLDPPPAAAPREASPPLSSAPPPVRFDWERWVGVRGAAALGACVLVIAGLYFFKYSIENDIISPAMRVVLGVLVGLGGLAASELTLRRNNTVLANWLAGAGVAILYTAFWFAHQLHLVPAPAAFGLMILVTGVCGLLAVRHDAMVIALLGLVGGFATPVALSTGEDHPFGLFGYLLLLDGALLWLAQRKRWPVLAGLSLLGTALYQAAWIMARMGPERLALGMGVLVVFGGVYAFAAPAARKGEGELWGITRAATVLLPFAFGLYFGFRGDLGDRLYPLGLMLCVVSAGACWMGRAKAVTWASTAAAVAGTTVMGVWLAVHPLADVAWEAAFVPALLAAVFHGFAELEAWRPLPDAAAARAAAIAGLGTLFCLIAAASQPSATDPWPWLAAWLLLGAIVVRQSFFRGYGGLRLGLAVLVDIGLVVVHAKHAESLVFPAERLHLVALVAVTGLGLLSAALAAREPPADAPPTSGPLTDEIAALLPFLTLVYFASRGELGPHLVPLVIALTALVAATARVAHEWRDSGWMVSAASMLGLGTIAVWMGRHALADVAWEVSLLVVAFALVLRVFVEVSLRRSEPPAPSIATWAALTPLGGILLLAAAAATPTCAVPWPWLVGWTLLAALALRQLSFPEQAFLHVVLAIELGLAFTVAHGAHAGGATFPSSVVWMVAELVTAVAFLAAGFRLREGPAARWAAHGAGTLALLLLVGSIPTTHPPPVVFFLVTIAFASVALIVAARLGAGGWSLAAGLCAALVHTGWALLRVPAESSSPADFSAAHTALAGQGLAVVLMAAWPLVAGSRLQTSLWAWRAAALAGPLWFAGLDHAWRSAFGRGAIGLLPVTLGLVTFAVAWRARPLLSAEVRRSALVWLLGMTLAAVSLAVPLQLENEWVTVGWALEGAALLALWRRLDHAGLKYTALAHLAVVAARLTVNPWVLGYHPRSGVPVFNWLAYTYWLPVAALLGAWFLLRDLEVPRERDWEGGLYEKDRPVWAMTAAAAAIVVFFVWINLTIFDAFGTGQAIEVVFERLPARDLTLSLAWAIYALTLLGVGMARRSAALRWASLALIIVTIGKVFLYDLSHLHDLYRVMSLVGLALSLILISLAYQRFVFGKRPEEG